MVLETACKVRWDEGMERNRTKEEAREIIDRAAIAFRTWKKKRGEEIPDNVDNPFCIGLDARVKKHVDTIEKETGISMPSCDELMEAYVQEKNYSDSGAVSDIPWWDRLESLAWASYKPITEHLATIATSHDEKLYRAYDFGNIAFGVKMDDEERSRIIDDVVAQARSGKMRSPSGSAYFGNPSFEGKSTSWILERDFIPKWSTIYFESVDPPFETIDIPSTYFVQNTYYGEEGTEIKIKAGATLPVTLYHEKKGTSCTFVNEGGYKIRERGEMVVDPVVKNKPVQF